MNRPNNWPNICAIRISRSSKVIARPSKASWKIEISKLRFTRPFSGDSCEAHKKATKNKENLTGGHKVHRGRNQIGRGNCQNISRVLMNLFATSALSAHAKH